jgi:hypothetical protein
MASFINPEALDTASTEELSLLAAACLERLEPGFQVLPLYSQLARHTVGSTVEVFGVEASENEPRILFSQRPDSDNWWGGQWHIPGSVLLPTDELRSVHDFRHPVERIFGGELANLVEHDTALTLFDLQRRDGARGPELTPFFWTSIAVDEDRLPECVSLLNGKDLTQNPDGRKYIVGHAEAALGAIASYYDPEANLRKLVAQFSLAA